MCDGTMKLGSARRRCARSPVVWRGIRHRPTNLALRPAGLPAPSPPRCEHPAVRNALPRRPARCGSRSASPAGPAGRGTRSARRPATAHRAPGACMDWERTGSPWPPPDPGAAGYLEHPNVQLPRTPTAAARPRIEHVHLRASRSAGLSAPCSSAATSCMVVSTVSVGPYMLCSRPAGNAPRRITAQRLGQSSPRPACARAHPAPRASRRLPAAGGAERRGALQVRHAVAGHQRGQSMLVRSRRTLEAGALAQLVRALEVRQCRVGRHAEVDEAGDLVHPQPGRLSRCTSPRCEEAARLIDPLESVLQLASSRSSSGRGSCLLLASSPGRRLSAEDEVA